MYESYLYSACPPPTIGKNLLRKLSLTLTLLICSSLALAQSIALSVDSASGAAGGTISLPINLTSAEGAPTAALQWSFGLSPDIIGVTVVASPSATDAGKSLSCSGNNCLISGINASVLEDGPIAIATFQLAANPSNGTIPIQLTNVIASSGSGDPITAGGASGSISLSPGSFAPSLQQTVSLSGLNCSSQTIAAPGASFCTVTLTGAALNAVSVTVLSSNTSVTVPVVVNIGAGMTSATFTATAAPVVSNQSAVVTATLNGVSQALTLNATASSPPQLSSVACTPSAMGSNASSTCTVTLNKTADTAATISLASSSGQLAVPGGVSIAAGQSSATFTATAGAVRGSQNITVTATLDGVSQQATINLTTVTQLSGLSCTPGTVSSGGPATCTVTVSAAASGTVGIILGSNNTSVTVPASVNIRSGMNSATFTAAAAAVVTNQSAVLTATLNGVSQTFTLTNTAPVQLISLGCTPAAMSSNVSSNCTVTFSAPAPNATAVSLISSSGLLTVPTGVTIPAGQSSANFTAHSGTVSTSLSVTVTGMWNGQSQQATIGLAPPVNCQEFQTSPGGLCMTQDLLPWITFGGGWESRLSAGNIPNGSGGAIQFSFMLLPSAPVTGGVQNHLSAWFKDSPTGQMQMAESAIYALDAGESVTVDFLASPTGCDAHGQNCGISQDPTAVGYGAVLIQYVSDNPAYLRGIAKAQLSLLGNAANGDYAWQTSELEMPPANSWTGPVAVNANPAANPQSSQTASAALANPGAAPITVRGTLYDTNGNSITFRDFQIPALGSVAMVFSGDPSELSGGFGNAMFPGGQDFNGVVSFQVISPNGGPFNAMVLQYVGDAMSSVELNSQTPTPIGNVSATRCAEFSTATDGTCTVQYILPWAVFGGGWESRLKAVNPPSKSAGAVQLGFTLLPAASSADGSQNHLPAYFTDSRSRQVHVGESGNYTLNAGQSVEVNFLYPPAGCDVHGQNCGSQPDPSSLSVGSVMVQYSSTDPVVLRSLAYPQLAFLARPSGGSYSSQITEHGAPAANSWSAPVAMSANQGADPLHNLAVSAAIGNPGTIPLTVRGTLLDQHGNIVTHNDFQVPATGVTGIVFASDPSQPSGGFGSAPFAQGQDFHGWVHFNVITRGTSGVSVVVLQYVGSTLSSVDAQSFR